MELFGRNSEVKDLLYNKGNVIHAYLGYYVIAIQKQTMDIASLVKKISGKGMSVVHSPTHSLTHSV